MASRATSYSDYYKNNDSTPGSDAMSDTITPTTDTTDPTSLSPEDRKKAAIRRRLLKKKASM